MACCTTMKHMCSWSGGTTKCGRCGDAYCNYHFDINNGGAAGGHACWCAEGRKSPAFGANCQGDSFFRCRHCGQRVCWYHGPPNNGTVGGHTNCRGPKCEVVVGGLTCGGPVSKCPTCEHNFCAKHRKGGLKHGVMGHGCDIGCATTAHTKVNCTGKRSDLQKCKLCAKVGNDYKYCQYHLMPVRTLVSIGAAEGGGHVCQGYTAGSMLFGDNASDLFLLASEMSITVLTGGTVNPAAASIAGNALKVAVCELLQLIGLDVLMGLRVYIDGFIDKHMKGKDEKKKKEKPAGEELRELAEKLDQIAKTLGKVNKAMAKLFSDQCAAVKAGAEQLDGVIQALSKAATVIDLGAALQRTAGSLTKALNNRVNPVAIMDACKDVDACMKKFHAACS